MLEVKIAQNVSEYRSDVFFGLSVREFIFSAAAVSTAVIEHFALQGVLSRNTLSVLIGLTSLPLGLAGFFSLNGMRLGKLCWQITYQMLMPRHLVYKSKTYKEDIDSNPNLR